MKDLRVRIKFLDGNVLTENVKSLSIEELFEKLKSRKEWYKISDGERYTYINPSAVVNIEITDVRENDEIIEAMGSFI